MIIEWGAANPADRKELQGALDFYRQKGAGTTTVRSCTSKELIVQGHFPLGGGGVYQADSLTSADPVILIDRRRIPFLGWAETN